MPRTSSSALALGRGTSRCGSSSLLGEEGWLARLLELLLELLGPGELLLWVAPDRLWLPPWLELPGAAWEAAGEPELPEGAAGGPELGMGA